MTRKESHHEDYKTSIEEVEEAPRARRTWRWWQAEAAAKMKLALAALVLVLVLNFPEAWGWVVVDDDWAAERIGQGALQMLAGGLVWHARPDLRSACAVMLVFGLARAACAWVWPDASDTSGSIFDKQTGIPGTLFIAGLAAWAAGRIK